MPKFHLPPIELKDERYCNGCMAVRMEMSGLYTCSATPAVHNRFLGLSREVTALGVPIAKLNRLKSCPLIPVKEEQEEKK